MADDKSKQDNRDRSQVSGGEEYEVRHFAEQNNISIEQAEQLIARHGTDRDELERAVQQMKG